ncbi:hypothetical protein [Mycoplasma nasistruthionis]|uniref:Uncharacterized protein n=1 Tax=Mycoplasma nasistruthionis TaxID=353852 RepID=A0A5B7XVG5_9MOLU|nr:hypothetical protein [Mycoplasma nasistruthionis]QCZ36454.1 hypothetical protein FG904_00215 [Mycoplasma nasistruthionis]
MQWQTILYIVLSSVLLLVVIFLFLLLLRNIYFTNKTKQVERKRIDLQRDETKNNAKIKQCSVISASDSAYKSVCEQLNNIKDQLEKQRNDLNEKIKNLNELITSRNHFKLLKQFHIFKQEIKKYQKTLAIFDNTASVFDSQWQKIDDKSTTYLDIIEEFKKILNKQKPLIKNLYPKLEEKIQITSRFNNDMDSKKYKGKFDEAQNVADAVANDLTNLYYLITQARQYEYLMYESLPNKILQTKNDKNIDKNFSSIFDEQYTKLQKLLGEWENKKYSALQGEIKNLLNSYLETVQKIKMGQEIKKLRENTNDVIFGSFVKIKDLYKKISSEIPITNIKKAYNLVENKYQKWQENRKIIKIVPTTQEYWESVCDFYFWYNMVHLNYKIEQDTSQYFNQRIFEVKQLYLETISDELIPNEQVIADYKNNLNDLFNNYFKKARSWSKVQEVWDDFVSQLSYITMALIKNKEYKNLYDKLKLIVSSNQAFLNKNNNLNKYKDKLKIIDLNIRITNNYKDAYFELKKYLKKESYNVQ